MTKEQQRIDKLEHALAEIRQILHAPASNRRFMQIAAPARQCLNIINPLRPFAHEATRTEDAAGPR